jgi:hypothetical protein
MNQRTEKRYEKVFRNPTWMLIAAFGTYFCMYGFRKPYTAATYSGSSFWGIDYKFLIIIAQTIGYVVAKWAGIKIVSEIKPNRRIAALLILIFLAELSLLSFGLIPRPWNIISMLLNGLFLGMVFGLVIGFLEGRQSSEALLAGLCTSFIVSDGASKSVGTLLLNMGVTENWMPFFAGGVFVIPTLIFIAMLSRVPKPSIADVTSRSERLPMQKSDRWNFFLKFAPGLSGIIIIYLFATLMRSVRADFAPEIWHGLGYPQTPAVFTQSELIVSFFILIINGLVIFIPKHLRALQFSLLSAIGGFTIVLIALLGLQHGMDKFLFMVLIGLGVYLPYVAVHTTIFERLIAITKERANIGFLMYLSDSVGYTGYVMLMLFKYTLPAGTSILNIFLTMCFYLGLTGGLITLLCFFYFKAKLKQADKYQIAVPAA